MGQSTVNQQSWDSMYTKGVLKPDRRIFEEIIEHAEFQVLDWS